jgi:chromosome segregation ATPase
MTLHLATRPPHPSCLITPQSEELVEATVAPKKQAEATRAAATAATAAATASHGEYSLAQQAIGRLSTQLQAQRDRVKEQEARMRELTKGRHDAAAALEAAQKALQRDQAALAKAQKECDVEGTLVAEKEAAATISGLQTAAIEADAEARGAEDEVRAAEARRREVAGKLARLGDYRLKRREVGAATLQRTGLAIHPKRRGLAECHLGAAGAGAEGPL